MTIRTDLYQAPIQDFIKPTLQEALLALIKILPQIHSTYLYGSAAKGSAIEGKSDIDLTIILNSPLTPNQQDLLSQLQETLQSQYPKITKIDFDFGLLEEALDKKEFYRWGYWLKHCCRHLQGENLQEQFPEFKPSLIIAKALNQDYQQAVLKDLALLQDGENVQQKILKNQICKRLIRASNITRPKEEHQWPYELSDYRELFQKWHPQHLSQLDYFYHLLEKEQFSPKLLKTHAQDFITTLETIKKR